MNSRIVSTNTKSSLVNNFFFIFLKYVYIIISISVNMVLIPILHHHLNRQINREPSNANI